LPIFESKIAEKIFLLRPQVTLQRPNRVEQLGDFICFRRRIVIADRHPRIGSAPETNRLIRFIALVEIHSLNRIGRQRRRRQTLKPDFVSQVGRGRLAFEYDHRHDQDDQERYQGQ
jgi:hypothetical protein